MNYLKKSENKVGAIMPVVFIPIFCYHPSQCCVDTRFLLFLYFAITHHSAAWTHVVAVAYMSVRFRQRNITYLCQG